VTRVRAFPARTDPRPVTRKTGDHPVIGKSLALLLLLLAVDRVPAATVYKWHDDSGTLHLSSDKPPAGVAFERMEVASIASPGKPATRSGKTATTPASAAQVAERADVLSGLRNRECVVALESLDRKTSATEPTNAGEIRRLQETVEANCSREPSRRQQQETMAAKLRVANGPECVDARNQLGTMLEPGAKIAREQLRAQQTFVDEHCVPPVR
jgi:hypothetical protein